MNKIFVYGTLKSKKIQKELFGTEVKMEKAYLQDYALYEASDGWFFIKPQKGSVLQGFVIELDDRCLKICDAFEYCPDMYQRKKVPIKTEKEEMIVDIYNRVDIIQDDKEITDFNSFSKYSEEDVIATEIKKFKEEEHPELFR